MTDRVEFYTETLAGIYASQGHLDKAIEIYKYLLTKTPESETIQSALSDAETRKASCEAEMMKRRPQDGSPEEKSLASLDSLIEEWIHLLLRVGRIRKLKAFQSRLKSNFRIHAS